MKQGHETVEASTLHVSASPCFHDYRCKWEARPPDITTVRFDDESVDLTGRDEVHSLLMAPLVGARTTLKRVLHDGRVDLNQDDKHLWLICVDDVKTALEVGLLGQGTKRGRLAHTNLSGGAHAHCGGELWFVSESTMYVNGGSGRYAPQSSEELDDSIAGFVKAGYTVCSFGWNELGRPARVLREANVTWIEPTNTSI
jgi:hypothetical protein